MNIFRIIADGTHIITILMFLANVLRNESCAGISGKAQILQAFVFTTRYLDLFFSFVSYYNSIMKCAFIVITYSTVFFVYSKQRKFNEIQKDTFRIEILIAAATLEACLINYEFTVTEVLWAFSIYLESVALLPQLFLISKSGVTSNAVCAYISGLGIYRAFYIFNWIYRYYEEGRLDVVSFLGGVVQTVLMLTLGLAVALPACKSNGLKDNTQEERNEPVQKAIHKTIEAWTVRLGAAKGEKYMPLVHKSTVKENKVAISFNIITR